MDNVKLNGRCACGNHIMFCTCNGNNNMIINNKNMELSELIDNQIEYTIKKYDNSYKLGDNSFEELISMGELVDRLSIINFKLYTLKDEVMRKPDDNDFKSWASVEDVKLCRERSRLKACIDKKLIYMINRVNEGQSDGGFNEEVKKYGNTPGKCN